MGVEQVAKALEAGHGYLWVHRRDKAFLMRIQHLMEEEAKRLVEQFGGRAYASQRDKAWTWEGSARATKRFAAAYTGQVRFKVEWRPGGSSYPGKGAKS